MSILKSSVDVFGNLLLWWCEGIFYMFCVCYVKIKWYNVGGDSLRLWKINKVWKLVINVLDY